ncbi:MAG: hypothetical protein AMK75_00630 [Planctomycetes bacterium SM23_65]|nr:MAG: hypothetical protein AMK75_00630 [Planctomycetes bacterium SM23_65]
MNTRWVWVAAVCLIVTGVHESHAQTDTARVAEFREERELIQQLEGEIPAVAGTTWDYGGWYRFSFTKFDDLGMDREAADHDVRLWGSLTLEDIHQFYFRVRTTWVDWAAGDAFNGNDWDRVGPNLDQGWYRLRLAKLARKYWKREWPCDVDVKVGRQYIEVGHGVVLSQILDAVLLDTGNYYFGARAFAAKTLSSNENLDVTAPKFRHDKRALFGFEASLKNVIPGHEPYAYALFVDDRNPYNAVPPVGQSFEYDPTYFGVGSRGHIINNLRYWAEYIWQRGHGHTIGTRIHADAWIAGLEYYFTSCPTRPRILVEYGEGSGDPDTVNPTNTVGGNVPGTPDEGFLAYGYHDTGVTFAPRLANLRVLRLTAACHPFEKCEILRNLEVGASYYWFDKDRRTGGVSDFRANLPRRDLGNELDLFANWRITSDLLFTVRWGRFMPGRAFSDRNDREYVLTSITYSF